MMNRAIKDFIHSSLKKKGYKVVKTNSDSTPTKFNATKKIKVEFVGPPGVGKSTVYRILLSSRKKEDNWFTPEEIYQVKERLVSPSDVIPLSNHYEKAIDLIYNLIISNSKTTTTYKINTLRYAHYILNQDNVIQSLNLKFKAVFDEGVFHTPEYMVELNKKDEESFKAILRNKATVNFYNSPEAIVNNFKERMEQGWITYLHLNKTDDELLKLTNTEIQNRKELLGLVEQNKVPVLDVNTADIPQLNAIKIKTFLATL